MMLKKVILLGLLLLSQSVLAGQSLQRLPEMVAILKEVHQVTVYQQAEDFVTVSWPMASGRKIDSKSLQILQKVTELTEDDRTWYFHLSVFCQLADGKTAGRSLSESQYKAGKMQKALKQLSKNKADIESVGLGNQIDQNMAYLTISSDDRPPIQVVAPYASGTSG